jgi:predicted NUDIX family phosphoesterase
MQNKQSELTGMPEPVEQILTLPADRFRKYTRNHFVTGHEASWLYDMIQHDGTFRERTDEMEKNVLFRQPVVYVVVQHYDGKILMFHRKPKQREQRLVNKFGIGIGGHVNPCDDSAVLVANSPDGKQSFRTCPGDSLLDTAARRELWEESRIYSGSLIFCGIVIENQTDIGRVHVGAVFHMLTNSEYINPEEEKHDVRWAGDEALAEAFPDMEIWSQLVYGHYLQRATRR